MFFQRNPDKEETVSFSELKRHPLDSAGGEGRPSAQHRTCNRTGTASKHLSNLRMINQLQGITVGQEMGYQRKLE